MLLLPPPRDTCPICGAMHKNTEPHNHESPYYHMRFLGVRGRWPTWADAIAHCSPTIQAKWKRGLQRLGQWSEPETGDPIADPPEESIHQPIGDPNSPGFGPDEES